MLAVGHHSQAISKRRGLAMDSLLGCGHRCTTVRVVAPWVLVEVVLDMVSIVDSGDVGHGGHCQQWW